MQSVSSGIWTRIVVSNSYNDNDYTTGTNNSWYAMKPNQTKIHEDRYDIKQSNQPMIKRETTSIAVFGDKVSLLFYEQRWKKHV